MVESATDYTFRCKDPRHLLSDAERAHYIAEGEARGEARGKSDGMIEGRVTQIQEMLDAGLITRRNAERALKKAGIKGYSLQEAKVRKINPSRSF